jgi:hypothetical protein
MATKYILTHPSGQYQINLTTSLEEYKKRLAANKDLLTLFNLDGTYAGVESPSFLDECEIKEENSN